MQVPPGGLGDDLSLRLCFEWEEGNLVTFLSMFRGPTAAAGCEGGGGRTGGWVGWPTGKGPKLNGPVAATSRGLRKNFLLKIKKKLK